MLNRLIEQQNKVGDRFPLPEWPQRCRSGGKRRASHADVSGGRLCGARPPLYARGRALPGVRQLLGYESGYSRKVHRFADYNAGRPLAATRLSGGHCRSWSERLALERSLAYNGRGEAQNRKTKARRRCSSCPLSLSLDREEIRGDPLKKSIEFTENQDLQAGAASTGKRFGVAPAFAVILSYSQQHQDRSKRRRRPLRTPSTTVTSALHVGLKRSGSVEHRHRPGAYRNRREHGFLSRSSRSSYQTLTDGADHTRRYWPERPGVP